MSGPAASGGRAVQAVFGLLLVGVGLIWGWGTVQQLSSPWPAVGHVVIVLVAVVCIAGLVAVVAGKTARQGKP